MAGTTAINQSAVEYICQSEGTGTYQLNALDSINVADIPSGCFALVQPTDILFRWYPADATPPAPGLVVKPIGVTTGRWKVVTSPVAPLAYYQTILNSPLNTALVPEYPVTNPVTMVQAPELTFVNLNAVDAGGNTVVTAWNQQFVYLDDLGGNPALVKQQRSRIMVIQSGSLGQAFRVVDVSDDSIVDQTVLTFYEQAYQQVGYGGNWGFAQLSFGWKI